MKFKIGFSTEPENREPELGKDRENATRKIPGETKSAKKSVVEVYFPERHLTCSYFNDMFDLKRGKIVYVDGKLAGLRGHVTAVNYSFKIRLSDYKRIIGVADTDVIGEFHPIGSCFITTDSAALNYEKVITWFKAPESADEEYISSSGGETFSLHTLGDMNIDKSTAENGCKYYEENRVQYIELNHGKGRAVVTGRKPYEIEFDYKNDEIGSIVCDCYCVGACKHEFAAMLQLRDILAEVKEEYPYIDHNNYLAIVNKAAFFKFVVDNKTNGTFTLG